ncbi:oligopeptide:H+ symporter [Francisella tularensis]|uniref:oligopeptide:H+ symporter n=1 Tax=Francisella tularensis TaxID=263 RepID=UPI0000F59141|nr:oligopeptide:H+ symporter [Francisella tularensis]ABO46579.1 amino acid/peptide transporter (Peptide:H+ symporter) [Francisella tularensis subsp. tularensis WY96-3418]EKM87474.1 amino acid/peptide transporter (peptide:H+ symporter) [Francisella tularensis subsp. tularensis 831]EKM87557.1 amino acid/peptide transporter (peptide:H+ symporter) [Francisella tularensis subsp. tularensis AS_713]EKM91526.1 amino acid/peptide transporter (peptide:H+ symporter) [Francisella tularensis subsp. tularens
MPMQKNYNTLSAPFWIVWGIELWERFGFYGFQAIIALYFTQKLGLSERETIYLMGSFFAFTYGFIWVGGLIGDKVLGAKRTILFGAVILCLSYLSFIFADKQNVYYIFSGIIIGNAIFKANPSSLISKMFDKGDGRLNSAMTLYYLAINMGGLICMALTPVISQIYGYTHAFILCGIGLFVGILGFILFYKKLEGLDTEAGKHPINKTHLTYIIAGVIAAFLIVANILPNTTLCIELTAVVVTIATLYFLYVAFSLESYERNRMLVALVLIIEAIIFYSLYFQMPTTLTFFAQHNVELSVFGWHVPAAQYQFLNPLWILILSPILAAVYKKSKLTHATKFCIGTALMFISYATLYSTRYFATNAVVSGNWLILSYATSSLGELLISGLGLAMVAELCPAFISGFVMGFWFLATMIASYVASYIGSFIALPQSGDTISKQQSLDTYTAVFGYVAIGILVTTIIMVILTPILNKYINRIRVIDDHKADIDNITYPQN